MKVGALIVRSEWLKSRGDHILEVVACTPATCVV